MQNCRLLLLGLQDFQELKTPSESWYKSHQNAPKTATGLNAELRHGTDMAAMFPGSSRSASKTSQSSHSLKNRVLLAGVLLICGIPTWISLAPTCPALVIKPDPTTRLEVSSLTNYNDFIQDQISTTGTMPAVTDWEPWLEMYTIIGVATAGAVPFLVALSAIKVFENVASVAAAVVAWAGVLSGLLFLLRATSYSFQNTTTSADVDIAWCCIPGILLGTTVVQLGLLLGSRIN